MKTKLLNPDFHEVNISDTPDGFSLYLDDFKLLKVIDYSIKNSDSHMDYTELNVTLLVARGETVMSGQKNKK